MNLKNICKQLIITITILLFLLGISKLILNQINIPYDHKIQRVAHAGGGGKICDLHKLNRGSKL